MERDIDRTVPTWVANAVFYQIFPDRFARHRKAPENTDLESWREPPTVHGFKGGTFAGIRERLDYLSELGITAIYLNPIFQSPANHRYHTHDYFRVDPILGNEEAFDRLLEAAHGKGIRIILDGVFNHVGRGFYQFNHVLENGKSSPYVNWFHLNPEHLEGEEGVIAFPHGEHRSRLGSEGGTFDVLGYKAWADLAPLPKLNTDTPAVRELLLEVGEYWIRRGVDGWRLDVPNEIDDPPFWQEFRSRVRRANPEAYIVGEIWTEAKEWLEGDRFDAVMNYPFSRGVLGFIGNDDLDTSFTPGGFSLQPLRAGDFCELIEKTLSSYREETNLAQLNLLGSHDTARLKTLLSGNAGRAALSYALLFALPGAPTIYYGDEVGLAGGDDPACRGGFPWDETVWDTGMREVITALADLRHAVPELRRGVYRRLFPVSSGEAGSAEPAESEDVAVVGRILDDGAAICAVNRGTAEATIHVPTAHSEAAVGKLSTPAPLLAVSGEGNEAALLPPEEGAELTLADGGFELRLPPKSVTFFTAGRSA